MTPAQFDTLVSANPDATCGDRIVFGVVLTRSNDTQWSAHVGNLHIIAMDDSVGVYMQARPYTSHSAFGDSLADAERAWLETASLHAPILCNAVVDLMGERREVA